MITKKQILFIALGIILVVALGSGGFFCGVYFAKEKNPTYEQMLKFLEKDKVANKQQLSVQYDQVNFAIDFATNAQKAGFKVGTVPLSLQAITYYVNVFDTKDRGLIYVDPQADKVVTVEVNKSYWGQNNFDPLPPFDDIVIKVYPPIW